MLAVRMHCQDSLVNKPRVRKSDKGRVIFLCGGPDPDCPFHVTAVNHPEVGGWRVVTCVLEHTNKCGTTTDNGSLPTKLVCTALRLTNRDLTSESAISLATTTALDYQAPDHQTKKLKALFVNQTAAEEDLAAYQRLPALLESICESWPNTSTHLAKHHYTNAFEGVFVALGAYKALLKHCLPLIALYGASLKTSSTKGTLLLAVMMDPDHNYFPLAFAVHPGDECTDSWAWFLQLLRHAVPDLLPATVFVSYRDKCLQAALAQVYPDSRHRWCLNHIVRNAKVGHLGSEFISQLYGVVKSHSKKNCDEAFAKLKLDWTSPGHRSFISDLSLENLADAYFVDAPTYGVRTNNIVESANNTFKEHLAEPVDRLVFGIVSSCTDRTLEIRAAIGRYNSPHGLLPWADKQLANKMKHDGLQVKPGLDWYTVETPRYTTKVELPTAGRLMKCSCGRMQDTGFPCRHLCLVAKTIDVEVGPLISPIYRLEKLAMVYYNLRGVNAVTFDFLSAPRSDQIHTPILEVPEGRPSSQPKPLLEIPSLGRGMMGVVVERSTKCGLCGQIGHNKRTCKNPALSSSSSSSAK